MSLLLLYRNNQGAIAVALTSASNSRSFATVAFSGNTPLQAATKARGGESTLLAGAVGLFTRSVARALGRVSTASLTGSVATYTTSQNINLTSLGGKDWAAFGYAASAASIERKLTGGSVISALSQVGGVTLLNYDNSPAGPFFSSTWTDGNPDASISNEKYVVYSNGPALGAGMSFTVPAGLVVQTLTVYVSVSYNFTAFTQGKLTATLSDASVSPYVDTSVQMTNGVANLLGKYTIIFSASSDNQTLTVSWVNNTSNAQNVQIYAAVLNSAVGPITLFALAASNTIGLVTIAGRASFMTSAAVVGNGLAGTSVKLGLRSVGKSAAIGVATFIGAIGLRAGGMAVGAARALGVIKTALSGSSAPISTARLDGFAGKVGLVVKGMAFSVGRLDGFSGKAALAAYSVAVGPARAAAATMGRLVARSVVIGPARAAGLFSAALRSASVSRGAGQAPISGKVLLVISAVASSAGRVAMSVRAILSTSALGIAIGRLDGFVGKIALKAVSMSTGSGRLDGFIGAVGLSARSAAVSLGRTVISVAPSVFLVAISSARSMGGAVSAGKLTLKSASKSAGFSASQLFGAINLKAIGIGLAAGRVASVVRAALQAITAAVAAAPKASSVGKTALAARTAANAVSLVGQSWIVQVVARSATVATSRAGAIFKTALQASATATGLARASTTGKIFLAARAGAAAIARAGISIIAAGFIFLVTSSRSSAAGRALSAGALKLSSRASAISSSLAGPAGKIQISARSGVVAAARAAMAVKTGFAAFSRGIAEGIGIPSGIVQLVSRGPVSPRGYAAASFVANLVSRSLGRTQAPAQITGILTITSTSSARSASVAKPSLFTPFTALSSFGRSVANSIALLFLKRRIFVDPDYVVRYPAPIRMVRSEPIRMVQYPAPIRMISYPTY
jgi:hypothetical protein